MLVTLYQKKGTKIMKQKILNLNLNGFRPLNKMKCKQRLFELYKFIDNEENINYDGNNDKPFLISLQEIIPGKDRKYLKQLAFLFPEYYLVEPVGFSEKNYRSAINILLINKELVAEYKTEVISTNESYSLLYNYVKIELKNGTLLNVINAHVQQTSDFTGKADWYVQKRLKNHKDFCDDIIKKCEQHKNDNLIVLGDLNKTSDSAIIEDIKKLGYCSSTDPKVMTYYHNMLSPTSAIDYILYSPALCLNRVYKTIVNNSICVQQLLTDHCLLIGQVNL